MNIQINNVTGQLIITPESEPDKLLLYHLINCMDLTQFTGYLIHQSISEPMTSDLGVTGEECIRYERQPVEWVTSSTGQTINQSTGSPVRDSLYTSSLIGFDRRETEQLYGRECLIDG